MANPRPVPLLFGQRSHDQPAERHRTVGDQLVRRQVLPEVDPQALADDIWQFLGAGLGLEAG